MKHSMKIDFNKKKVLQLVADVFYMAVFSAVVLFLTEWIYRGDIEQASEWFWSYKWNTLYNMFFILGLEAMFYVLTCNMMAGMTAGAVIPFLLAVISSFKYQARGEVLRLSDISSAGEGISVMKDYSFHIPGTLGIAIAVVLVFLLIMDLRRKKRIKIPFYIRIIVIVMIAAAVKNAYVTDKKIGMVGGNTTLTIVKNFYDTNGFLAGLLRTYSGEIDKPGKYSEKSVDAVLAKITEEETTGGVEPDIVVVLMESLYDMTRIDGVTFNTDPLEKFKQLQKECISGQMLSPVRGGGTCNAEYSVLTGYPTGNTPNLDLIYQSGVIKTDPGSIIDLLKAEDYTTTAIHGNDGAFFNRDTVYPILGFDKLIFKKDILDYETEGVWMSDKSLYDTLISEYENRDSSKGFFTFALTMQLHGGYDYDFNQYGIQYTGSDLTREQEKQLNTYANLEYGSVQALSDLLEYFSAIHHPVVVMAFGDHAPGTEAFGIDGETNPERNNDEYYTLQTTPFLIWNNYSENVEDWGTVSSYKLGAKLMQYCNIPLDSYFTFLLEKNVPEGSDVFFISGDKMIHKDDLDKETTEVLDDLWILQYDRMFGENYAKQ